MTVLFLLSVLSSVIVSAIDLIYSTGFILLNHSNLKPAYFLHSFLPFLIKFCWINVLNICPTVFFSSKS